MPLIEPTIDDRSYQQILNEALARIPVHNPEWTNHTESDPGITLLQLYAFMTESLLYRANRIPERNRVAFLKLLGIPVQPAEAARGFVTFSNPRGPLEVRLLPPDLELFAGPAPFRTLDGLDVLPIEAQVYYKRRPELTEAQRRDVEALYRQLYRSYDAPGVTLAYYETRLLEPPASGAALPVLDLQETVDGKLWVALLARTPAERERARTVLANKVLTLALVPALTEEERVLPPGGQTAAETQGSLVYELPHVQPGATVAAYKPLQGRPSANLLLEPGIVELPLPGADALRTWQDEDLDPLEAGVADFPPSLEDAAAAERLLTWIRIQPGADAPAGGQLKARFSFVGVNAARVTQRARVFAEFLGQGTGEPDQAVTLVNTPVLVDSVQLTVNGERWTRVDDLAGAAPEVPRRGPRTAPGAIEQPVLPEASKVYTVDRESGLVRFGTGMQGARPPLGAILQAAYDYGGGLQGMVGIGAITQGPSLPSGVRVTNPIPTWGGDEPETVAEAERRIPTYLRHRDRLVSPDDFRDITYRTPGVDIGRVEVRPLLHPSAPDVPADGVVTLVVIPKYDAVQPDAPRPDRLFLETVCAYLNPRRLVTTELHVRGPAYVGLYASVGIDVVPGRSVAPVREAVKNTLFAFLSPLFGGFDGQGWPLDHDVELLELLAVAARVDGVSKINRVRLGRAGGPDEDAVPMSGLQLPRLLGVAVQVGDAAPLDTLQGQAAPPPAERVVPVPIVLPEC